MIEKDGYVLFFTKNDFLSNFYYAPFKHKNILFKWSEQAVMYEKAMLFGATDIAKQILNAQSPMECKKFGRSRSIPFDEETWENNKIDIYTDVLRSKFKNPRLRQMLLNTQCDKFIEASPYDSIWGVKMNIDDPNITNPQKWKGLNLLGHIFTALKQEIKDEVN